MRPLKLSDANPAELAEDVLVVGVTSKGSTERLFVPDDKNLTRTIRRAIESSLTMVGASAKPESLTRIPPVAGVSVEMILAVGLGDPSEKDFGPENLRRAAGRATLDIASGAQVVISLPANTPSDVAAIAQGALLGAYRFEDFRGTGTSSPKKAPRSITVVTQDAKDRHVKEAVRRSATIAKNVNFARSLVNAPPSALHPRELAEATQKEVTKLPIQCTVLDERALKRGGYGGILAVGQGSANPPRLIRMEYTPARPKVHIALVGKGITFDSGGLSLKPPKAMETMKCDMGGAAAVIAATLAIAELKIPARITTYAACAENMPSGTAQRPGDVLTTYGGTTVEVLNTDAEGRLVLADALVRAGEDEPDYIIDVATLTGAQMVALGSRVSAVMGNDSFVREDVVRAAELTGEQFWQMPLPKELRKSLDSPIADLSNIGDRMGGMLVAGLFLQEFIPNGTPWAHLDIAGPAFNEGAPHGYTPTGGTGVAVRTLVQFVKDTADSNRN